MTPQQEASIDKLFSDKVARLLFGESKAIVKNSKKPNKLDREFVVLVQRQTQEAERKIKRCRKTAIGELREQSIQELIDSQASLVREGIEARQSLIQSNLRWAVRCAKGFLWSGMGFLDLIGYAEEGLTEAATKYDYRRGKFSHYAMRWMRVSIIKGLCESLPICLPRRTHGRIGRLKEEWKRLAQELGEGPNLEELAKRFDTRRHTLASALRVTKVVSLNKPIGDDGRKLGDFIPDDGVQDPQRIAEGAEIQKEVKEALASDELSDRERNILRLRFGVEDGRGRTLEEVGGEFSVTRERIRQIEAKALRILRCSKVYAQRLRELLPYDPKASPTTAAKVLARSLGITRRRKSKARGATAASV